MFFILFQLYNIYKIYFITINKKYLTLSNINIKKYTPNKKGTFLFFRKSFTKNIKKEKIDENKKLIFV